MISSPVFIKFKKELDRIKKRYEKKYGIAVFDVAAEETPKKRFILSGKVLSEKQKKEACFLLKQVILKAGLKSGQIENKIRVISDPKEKLEIGWGKIKVEVADFWVDILNKKKKKTEKIRATQALKKDTVRILMSSGRQYLAQTSDLAIGWIKKYQISLQFHSGQVNAKCQKLIREWKDIKRAKPGEMIKISFKKNKKNKFISFLKKYLRAPYLLGGTTTKGIDCSGLTQKFYAEVYGVLLPRHSADQALCGKEVYSLFLKTGDLIFLRHKINKYPHIGLVINKSDGARDILILNARKETGKVIIESFSEIIEKYKLIRAKRVIFGN